MPRDASFYLAVEDPHISRVTAIIAAGLDALDPGSIPFEPAPSLGRQRPRAITIRRNSDVTVISGRVPGWRDTWEPIRIHFFGASTQRDLDLLLLGGAVGLGFALLVQGGCAISALLGASRTSAPCVPLRLFVEP
jgi:hypothetical protein